MPLRIILQHCVMSQSMEYSRGKVIADDADHETYKKYKTCQNKKLLKILLRKTLNGASRLMF